MLPSALVLLPLLLLPCLAGPGASGRGAGGRRTREAGEGPLTAQVPPGAERGLPAPTDVRFQARLAHHLLRWRPGPKPGGGVLYEVQYRRVGNDSWRAAANCTRVAPHSCDLTCETQRPAAHYLARVRAVAGSRRSAWTQTRRFAPQEATLWLAKVTLSGSGNRLHVSLQLPTSCRASPAHEDSYEAWGGYLARVRRASSSEERVHLYSSLEFDLPPLLWGEKYCISVKPRVASRPNPADWTREQCVSIPALEEHTGTPVLTPGLALLTLLSLGALGAGLGLASAHKKKPTTMPSVLKPPLRRGFRRGLVEESDGRALRSSSSSSSSSLETETVQPLFLLGPREGSGGPRPGALLPERSRWRAEGRALGEGSGCSADSGICLQETSGGEDGLHSALGVGREAGLQNDAGSFGRGEQPLRGEGPPPKGTTAARCSGYRQQSGAPLGPEDCLGPPSHMGGETLPHPSLTTGYLKQTFLGAPSPQGLPPLRGPGERAPPKQPLLGPLGAAESPCGQLRAGASPPASPEPGSHPWSSPPQQPQRQRPEDLPGDLAASARFLFLSLDGAQVLEVAPAQRPVCGVGAETTHPKTNTKTDVGGPHLMSTAGTSNAIAKQWH